MEFNVEKCKVMNIGGTNRNFRYFMDQKQLEVVQEEKDLGVVITNDLKASYQCTAACNKANRILGMINRTIIVYKSNSVGACVADTNARGQLMLILGTMHNFEEYAIVIQKKMVPFFNINFDTILTGFNSNRENAKLSAGYFL